MTYYEVPRTFTEWRKFAQYSIIECVATFKVSRQTVNNWESGRIEPPRATIICLMIFSGRLDHLGKQWRGFRINTDCIESPEGDFIRAGEIRAFRYAMQSLNIDRSRRFAPVTFIDNTPKKADIQPREAIPDVLPIRKFQSNT